MRAIWRRLSDYSRHRKILRKGLRLRLRADISGLTQLTRDHEGTQIQGALRAMLARCYADCDDRDAALRAFNELYADFKSADAGQNHYLKLFALFNIALIRNSVSDAAYFSRRTREVAAPGWMRAYLPIPLFREQPRPGTVITASR